MKRKQTRRKFEAGTRRWNAIIQPYAEASAVRGNVGKVTEALKLLTGEDVSPQQVRQWLVPDPEGRPEPRAGMAMYLLEACANVKACGGR